MGKGKKDKRASGGKGDKVAKLPKKKCCVTAPKCNRCPLRMLKEGTLPEGYTVHKRKLVKTSKLDVAKAGKSKQGKNKKKNKKLAA